MAVLLTSLTPVVSTGSIASKTATGSASSDSRGTAAESDSLMATGSGPEIGVMASA